METKYCTMKDKKKFYEMLFPKLREALFQEKDIVFAYLFGSYGKGKPHRQSDVDVAVYLKAGVDFFERRFELINLISSITKHNEVDVVILNTAKPFMVQSVLRTGILLFSKDETQRLPFIVKNVKQYLDLNYLLKKHWEAQKKRIKEKKFGF